MLRGINRQHIFEEDEDYVKFLQIVEDYQSISKYKVHDYCMMGNHVHLLIGKEEPLGDTRGRFCCVINLTQKNRHSVFSDFQLLDRKTRDEYLRLFKEKGISIRQISRWTGVSYYVVQKV